MKNFQYKNSDIFHISAQNIDCGYLLELPQWGGSNEYSQYVLNKNKKNNIYPCKPQFYYIKVGFKGVKTIYACFRDATKQDLNLLSLSTEEAKGSNQFYKITYFPKDIIIFGFVSKLRFYCLIF